MQLEETDNFVGRRHGFVLKDPARRLVNDLAHERQVMFERRHQHPRDQGRVLFQAQDNVPRVVDTFFRQLDEAAIELVGLIFKGFLPFRSA